MSAQGGLPEAGVYSHARAVLRPVGGFASGLTNRLCFGPG